METEKNGRWAGSADAELRRKPMKKCMVISDSFKGTLSSLEICRIARETIGEVFPGCEVLAFPVADGGEGTVACFLEAMEARPVTVEVCGPLGGRVQATYARREELAVIEMASAAGLPMVEGRSDPVRATTYGVGELIGHAVRSGCREILLGMGGSATNDGGCGCAAALGVQFFDGEGRSFVPDGGTLDRIAGIDISQVRRRLQGVTLTLMSDVDNPLFGENGAACVFGPQKGAGPELVRFLDGQLRALDAAIRRELGVCVADVPGAGAAGGLGAGCMAFLGGQIKSGIEAVLELLRFDEQLPGTELVITGEGRVDAQSVQGKVISGIARRTRARGVPLIAIAGSADDSSEAAYALGVDAIFTTDRTAVGFEQLRGRCGEDYRRTLRDVLRLLRVGERMGRQGL